MSDDWRVRQGERVQARREERGLSQAQLADKAGTTQQTVSRIETGAVDPKRELKMRIARVLVIHVSRLFGYTEQDVA